MGARRLSDPSTMMQLAKRAAEQQAIVVSCAHREESAVRAFASLLGRRRLVGALVRHRCGDLALLLNRLAELSCRWAEKPRAILQNAALPEHARRQRVARPTRLLKMWTPTCRCAASAGRSAASPTGG
eukprot:917286-Alexandrium_andersonii.AAC.1